MRDPLDERFKRFYYRDGEYRTKKPWFLKGWTEIFMERHGELGTFQVFLDQQEANKKILEETVNRVIKDNKFKDSKNAYPVSVGSVVACQVGTSENYIASPGAKETFAKEIIPTLTRACELVLQMSEKLDKIITSNKKGKSK